MKATKINKTKKMEQMEKAINEFRSSIEKKQDAINEILTTLEEKERKADEKGKIKITAILVIATAKVYSEIITDTFDSIVERVAPVPEIEAWATGKKDAPNQNQLNKILSNAEDLFTEFEYYNNKMAHLFGDYGDQREFKYLTDTNNYLDEYLRVLNKYTDQQNQNER